MMTNNCETCGLEKHCKSPHMRPDGPQDAHILVVGEAPGAEEDEQGRPFVGRSGQLLRNALKELGYPSDIRFTNVVLCRPPDNKISKKYIKYCKDHLQNELNNNELELVLLCGNVPLNAVLGETGIAGWNGVVIERDGLLYVPVYHPAYVLRDPSKTKDWLDALDNALDALDYGVEDPYSWEYIFPDKIDEIKDMCDELMRSPVIAFDIETATLDPWCSGAHIVVCSFANDEKAWAVPIRHREKHMPYEALEHMMYVLENHNNIIGHNIAAFDQLHVKVCWGVDFQSAGDSMLASYVVDSRRGIHGLKHLAGKYLGMYDYDRALDVYIRAHPDANPNKGGSYANVPLHILLQYAAYDAAASYATHEIMLGKMTEKQLHLYRELIIPASNALMRMKYNGVAIDAYVVDRYMKVYGSIRADLYDDICADEMVVKYVKDRQCKLDKQFNRKKNAGRRVSKRTVFEFNPNSSEQVADVLYGEDYYNLPVMVRTATGKPSTSRAVLKDIDDLPLVKNLIYYKLLGKMLSTYIEPLASGKYVSKDGRIHADYLLHGTETGRLASRNPNMQNIPTPEKEPGTVLEMLPIKNMYTHTWDGGCLMSVDYSGMELRVFASLADCQPMLDIHRSGADFHSMVASMMTGLPVEKITKPVRYIYKWTNWTLLYGGDAHTLHNLYGIPMKDAEKAVATYYRQFPEVLEYKQDCVRFAREHGYIETPFGRRRWLNMNAHDEGMRRKAEREAVNTPVQSAASDITLAALVILDKLLAKNHYKTMIVNTVHDSIVLDVYPGELDDVAHLCVDVMENIVHYAHLYMPHLDFSWLKAPLKADVEVGSHYGMLEKYEVDHE